MQLIRFTETQSFTKNFAVHDEEVEGILEDVVVNGGYSSAGGICETRRRPFIGGRTKKETRSQ